MKLITAQSDFTKAVKSIAGRGARLDGDIQLAALSALAQLQNGNPNWANELHAAMPKGGRALALREWFVAFGNVVQNTDKASYKEGKVFVFDKAKSVNMADAEATPWYDFKLKNDREAPAFDPHAYVQSVLAKLKTQAKLEGERAVRVAALLGEVEAVLAESPTAGLPDAPL